MFKVCQDLIVWNKEKYNMSDFLYIKTRRLHGLAWSTLSVIVDFESWLFCLKKFRESERGRWIFFYVNIIFSIICFCSDWETFLLKLFSQDPFRFRNKNWFSNLALTYSFKKKNKYGYSKGCQITEMRQSQIQPEYAMI